MLRQIEHRIQGGLQAYVATGLALRDIKEQELWRDGFDSFKLYCQQKWSLPPEWVDRIISTATCVDNIHQHLPPGWPMPTNELQIRPLLELEPEDQAKAWQEAAANSPGRQPTPATVQIAAYTREPKPLDHNDDEAVEIRTEFLVNLEKLSEDKFYSGERLQKVLGLRAWGVGAFVAMCEVSPCVQVWRRNHKNVVFYRFQPTQCVLGRDRIQQLAQSIAETDNIAVARANAERMLALLGV